MEMINLIRNSKESVIQEEIEFDSMKEFKIYFPVYNFSKILKKVNAINQANAKNISKQFWSSILNNKNMTVKRNKAQVEKINLKSLKFFPNISE